MTPSSHSKSLTPEEAALFQALSRSAIVYLLMRRLGRPLIAREIADLLGLHEQTAAKYLRSLARLNLVEKTGPSHSYVLLADKEIALAPDDQAACPLPENPVIGGQTPHETIETADQYHTRQVPQASPVTAKLPATPHGSSRNEDQIPAQVAKSSQHQDDTPTQPVKKTQHPEDIPIQTVKKTQHHEDIPDQTVKITQHPDDTPTQPVKKTQHPEDIPDQTVKLSQHPDDIPDQTVKISQFPSININNNSTDNVSNNHINNSEEVLLLRDDPSKNSQLDADDDQDAVWQELFAAGINNNARTRKLVRLPHITAAYVRGHRLKLEASGKSGEKWAGLLVTILESGRPAPELNPNDHLATCNCAECYGYKIARSWEDTW